MKVAIIGGGITGCAAVLYLNRLDAVLAKKDDIGGISQWISALTGIRSSSTNNESYEEQVMGKDVLPEFDITVFEKEPQLGGYAVNNPQGSALARQLRFVKNGPLSALVNAASSSMARIPMVSLDHDISSSSFSVYDYDKSEFVFSSIPLWLLVLYRFLVDNRNAIHVKAGSMALGLVFWVALAVKIMLALGVEGAVSRMYSLLSTLPFFFFAIRGPRTAVYSFVRLVVAGYAVITSFIRYGMRGLFGHGACNGSIDSIQQFQSTSTGTLEGTLAGMVRSADLSRLTASTTVEFMKQILSKLYAKEMLCPLIDTMEYDTDFDEFDPDTASSVSSRVRERPREDQTNGLVPMLALSQADILAVAPGLQYFALPSGPQKLCDALTLGAKLNVGNRVTKLKFSTDEQLGHTVVYEKKVMNEDGSGSSSVLTNEEKFDAVIICCELGYEIDVTMKNSEGKKVAPGEVLGRRIKRQTQAYTAVVQGSIHSSFFGYGEAEFTEDRLTDTINVIGSSALKRMHRIFDGENLAVRNRWRLEFATDSVEVVNSMIDGIFLKKDSVQIAPIHRSIYKPTVYDIDTADQRVVEELPSFLLGLRVMYPKSSRKLGRDLELDLVSTRNAASWLSKRVRWARKVEEPAED